MIFGTDNFNQYQGWLAPGLRDALWNAERCKSEPTTCPKAWEDVKKQLSNVLVVINSAILTLKDFSSF